MCDLWSDAQGPPRRRPRPRHWAGSRSSMLAVQCGTRFPEGRPNPPENGHCVPGEPTRAQGNGRLPQGLNARHSSPKGLVRPDVRTYTRSRGICLRLAPRRSGAGRSSSREISGFGEKVHPGDGPSTMHGTRLMGRRSHPRSTIPRPVPVPLGDAGGEVYRIGRAAGLPGGNRRPVRGDHCHTAAPPGLRPY